MRVSLPYSVPEDVGTVGLIVGCLHWHIEDVRILLEETDPGWGNSRPCLVEKGSQLRQGPSPPTQCESSGDPSFRTKPSLQELTSEVSSRLSPRCPPQQTAIPESQQQPLRGHRQSPRPACPS